ncbi:MAG TPA: rhodanese [Gammaproteobacteria bacterium]|nr:rhodanese [Gammaproteobacteria bacterium]
MIKPAMSLVAEAEALIETVTTEQVLELLEEQQTCLVDIRDVRELYREGKIPGAMHAPRGMLEFWVDPQSPYHKPEFATGQKFILYCGGGWRSALATRTLQEMGLSPIAHMGGGFSAWKEAGYPIEEVARK